MIGRLEMLALCGALAGLWALPAACKRGAREAGDSNVPETRSAAHVLLVGTWTRASDLAPVVHEQVYRVDGGFILREYGQGVPVISDGNSETRRHRRYSLDLPLTLERQGRWRLDDDATLTLQISLAGGDPVVSRLRLEEITSSRLVLSTDGPDGRVQLTDQRTREGSRG